jgi:hypothetical protein
MVLTWAHTTVKVTTRRRFLGGALSLIAAPAIVKIASIMPVKSLADIDLDELLLDSDRYLFGWADFRGIYGSPGA